MNTHSLSRTAIRITLAVFLLGCVHACGTTRYVVRTFQNESTGTTINRMVGNSLGSSSFYKVSLQAQCSQETNGTVTYDLIVTYRTQIIDSHCAYPLFLESGETLILTIDGRRVALSGDGSKENRRHSKYSLWERALYRASPELIKQIANSREVQVKLLGSKGSIDAHFVEGNFDNFKEFVKDYVKDSDPQ